MAINKSYVATAEVTKYGASIIKILSEKPPVSGVLSTPMTPGPRVGYYDGISDTVLLYVVSGGGYRLLKVS
jgi:hypothetical protein